MSVPPEFSRPYHVERIGRSAAAIVVDAAPAECAAVARRLLIPAVARLRCTWTLRRGEGAAIHAAASLQAEVTQDCVVSMEPVAAHVAELFDVCFVLEERPDADDPDEPDQLVYDGMVIDLGEAAVEQLALALDPYPRHPEAALPADVATAAPTPFDGLAKLRRLD